MVSKYTYLCLYVVRYRVYQMLDLLTFICVVYNQNGLVSWKTRESITEHVVIQRKFA
jgi:hypothetical protein